MSAKKSDMTDATPMNCEGPAAPNTDHRPTRWVVDRGPRRSCCPKYRSQVDAVDGGPRQIEGINAYQSKGQSSSGKDFRHCHADPCGHSIAYEQITTGKTIRRRWIPWATMLLKVFAVDVLACPNCQGRMQRIAWTIRPQRSAGRIGPHRRSRWRPRRGEGQGPESNAAARH